MKIGNKNQWARFGSQMTAIALIWWLRASCELTLGQAAVVCSACCIIYTLALIEQS